MKTAPSSPILTKQALWALLGILALIIVGWLIPPPLALSEAALIAGSTGALAMKILAVTVMTIVWWVGGVFPDWLSTLAMLLLWIVLADMPFTTAFAGFASPSNWLIVGAFCLAAAVTKAGVFQRLSCYLMKLFAPTFSGQVLALLIVGTVCAPLVPSATAKAVLGATMAFNIANAMGYPPESKGRYGLFVASWIGFGAIVPAFMSGGVFNYTLLGTLSPEVLATVTWTSWFVTMLPWLILVLLGCFFGIRFLYAPKEASTMTREHVNQQYAKLGKASHDEKLSSLLLAGAVFFWVFEGFFGFSATVVALGAAFLCFALGLLEPHEISTVVPWGMVIFLGGVLNLGIAFAQNGIDLWLQGLLTPIFNQLGNPVAIVVAVTIFVLAIRLLLASQSAVIVLSMAIVVPAAQRLGFPPFLVGLVIYCASQCWFFPYQNAVYAPSLGCMKGTIQHKKTMMSCVLFELISMGTLLLSLPYWSALGLMG